MAYKVDNKWWSNLDAHEQMDRGGRPHEYSDKVNLFATPRYSAWIDQVQWSLAVWQALGENKFLIKLS